MHTMIRLLTALLLIALTVQGHAENIDLGPYTINAQVSDIVAFLNKHIIEFKTSDSYVPVPAIKGYQVLTRKLSSRQALETFNAFRGAHFHDYYYIPRDAHVRHASVGVFSTMEAAERRRDKVRAIGIDAFIIDRHQPVKVTTIRINSDDVPTSLRWSFEDVSGERLR